MTTTINTELKIEYEDYDEYENEPDETIINATITVENNDLTITTDGWTTSNNHYPDDQPDNERTWRVHEERNKILISPIKQYGARTTQPANYTPGSTRLEPCSVQHNGKYVAAITAPEIRDTLTPLVENARNEYKNKHDIEPVENLDIDVPDITLEVREGTPMFPSSKTGKTMAPREDLVVEPTAQHSAYTRWHDAIVETTNRYEVWTGTAHKNTDELLAPPEYDAGDTLSLSEYLDSFYTINPAEVADAAAPQDNDTTDSDDTYTDDQALAEAAKTGDDIVINRSTTHCNDPNKECNTDRVLRVATPDGDIETRRTHMH